MSRYYPQSFLLYPEQEILVVRWRTLHPRRRGLIYLNDAHRALRKRDFTIGSAPDAHIRLEHPSVAPRHVQFLYDAVNPRFQTLEGEIVMNKGWITHPEHVKLPCRLNELFKTYQANKPSELLNWGNGRGGHADSPAHTRERNQSAKKRMKNTRDHDARSMGRKFVIDMAAARISHQVKVAKDKAERATSARSEFIWEKEVGRSLFVDYEPPPSQWISSFDAPSLLAGETELLKDLSVAIRRGEKIWLKGANGAGKTTLMLALYKASPLQKQKLFTLPQELSEEEQVSILERTKQLAPKEKGQVLSLVAALGVEPERVLSSKKPSPGEARKLALAYGLGTCSWALFFDEPTNHLDLPSIERLEEALATFPGAMLLISHDEAFAKRCTQRCWEIQGGSLIVS